MTDLSKHVRAAVDYKGRGATRQRVPRRRKLDFTTSHNQGINNKILHRNSSGIHVEAAFTIPDNRQGATPEFLISSPQIHRKTPSKRLSPRYSPTKSRVRKIFRKINSPDKSRLKQRHNVTHALFTSPITTKTSNLSTRRSAGRLVKFPSQTRLRSVPRRAAAKTPANRGSADVVAPDDQRPRTRLTLPALLYPLLRAPPPLFPRACSPRPPPLQFQPLPPPPLVTRGK